MRRALCLLAMAVAWAPSGKAIAERVSIVTYRHEREVEPASTVAEAMAQAAQGADAEVVDAIAQAREWLEAGAVPESSLAPFELARSLRDEGWRGYLEARPTFAASRLAQARTEAVTVAQWIGGSALLADVSLRLGAVKLALGREAEAADDFRLAHDLDADLEVSDRQFKPEVVERFERAVSEARDTHAMVIEIEPAAAELQVDGRKHDASAPVRLSDGLHLVSATAPGFEGRAQLLSVSAMTPKIVLSLPIDVRASAVLEAHVRLRPGASEEVADRVISSVLSYSGVDVIVLVTGVWRRGQPALLGQLCAPAPARCGRVVEVGYPAGGVRVAAEELWRQMQAGRSDARDFPPTLQADARLVRAESSPRPGGGATVRSRWWQNRWLWIGVGVAAAAGGAALLLGQEDEISPVFTGRTCDFGGC